MLKSYKIRHYEKKIKTMTKEESIEFLSYKKNKSNEQIIIMLFVLFVLIVFGKIANKFNLFDEMVVISVSYLYLILRKAIELFHIMILLGKITFEKNNHEVKK